MKKIKIVFILHCSMLIMGIHPFGTNCLSQWLQQTSGVTSPLYDCDFINQNTGWACGDGGVILKTTNGGINWVQQTSGVIKILYGIDAVDANIVYCVGWFQTILKSSNGGTNWIIIRNGPTGTGRSFNKTYFLNSSTGWLISDGVGGGWILRTANGTSTFDSVQINNSFPNDIYFQDAIRGVLCANGAYVSRSTDGGVSWNQVPLPLFQFEAPNLYRISFVGDYGWTIGEGGSPGMGRLVYKTTNFGISWDSIGRVPYPSNELNYSVFFSSLNTGYCGGTTGYTFKTTDGGFNWYQQVTPVTGFRNDFWFANDTVGWVVGGGGRILHTTTGGQYVGVQNLNTELPLEHNLKSIFPNPFNPSTTITFEIAHSDNVKLIIYDILGRMVEVLVNEKLIPGSYRVTFNGENLSSGIYLCNLVTSKIQKSKTMILMK